jgi:hypothetical protein
MTSSSMALHAQRGTAVSLTPARSAQTAGRRDAGVRAMRTHTAMPGGGRRTRAWRRGATGSEAEAQVVTSTGLAAAATDGEPGTKAAARGRADTAALGALQVECDIQSSAGNGGGVWRRGRAACVRACATAIVLAAAVSPSAAEAGTYGRGFGYFEVLRIPQTLNPETLRA